MKLTNAIRCSIIAIAILYFIFLVDLILPLQLNQYGIVPREARGLKGILFAPFLHSGWFHLLSNTIPLLTLLSTLLFFYKNLAFRVTLFSLIIGGVLVWIFGRPAIHIGASGLIYSYAFFLVAFGIFKRDFKSVLIAIAIGALHVGMLQGLFPTHWYISWEGHLFGATAGVVLAYIYRNRK